MKLITLLLQGGGSAADLPLWMASGRTITRGQAISMVACMVQELHKKGLRPGGRVLAIIDHDENAVLLLMAASALGLRLILPYNLAGDASGEWRAIIAAYRPDAVVAMRAAPALEEFCSNRNVEFVAPNRSENSPLSKTSTLVPILYPRPIQGFITLFTSGTSGTPKAISHGEESLCRKIGSVASSLSIDSETVAFQSGLMNNTTGVLHAFGAMMHMGRFVVPASRRINTWPDEIARVGATHIMLRPPALQKFLNALDLTGADLSCLRVLAYGAAATPAVLIDAARTRLSCAFVQGYGLSETFGPFCWLDESAHVAGAYHAESHMLGRPGAECSIRIANPDNDGVGEILVRDIGMMEGYVRPDGGVDPVSEEGFATGDIGRFDDCGRLVLKGRHCETIIAPDGHRMYPEEIEAQFRALSGVDEALLVDASGSSGLDALPAVCLVGPVAALPVEALRKTVSAHLTGQMAREKWPWAILPMATSFPRNTNGKIDRRAVANIARNSDLVTLKQDQICHETA
jgi:acyl-CoA synthetase (AMP-forming)/AMP-acid ligase II